ncbi:DUF222 domain-containing protein [Demequina sp. SYSU T00039]|uniref:DUF222 domain-containing protein n=1 Tax=Demequina lignilytica TaxID=3051663 RepID=A0AAW7M3A8_9MICO|nr:MULTISPECIES: HNH endonuclease signature motif containing protein [unclassified Demequina]MDN4477430.1 DUF222 domain-containing protein [Demequina sp. SYSU T00039-1]MDN4488219.1 DUF222 domain-containing protein [Demequina sp. SYSU T00039]
MEFSDTALYAALAALHRYADTNLLELDEPTVVEIQDAAALVMRLAEVPFATTSAVIEMKHAAAARRRGHQNATSQNANAAGTSHGRARDLAEAGGLFGGEDDEEGQSGGTPDDADGGNGGNGENGGGDGGEEQQRRELPKPPKYPLAAASFAAGRIGTDKAALLARTLDKLGDRASEFEEDLVERAERLSLRDLRRACESLLARLDTEAQEEKERRQHAERAAVIRRRADGMVELRAVLDPASAAPVVAWCEAQVSDAYKRRRTQDPALRDTRSRVQILADAVTMLFTHGLDCESPGSGAKTTVVVRLSLEALQSGRGTADCDQLETPLSAAAARRLAVDAGFLPIVLGGKSQVLDLGSTRRLFSHAQRVALLERDGGCAFCHAPPQWTAAHHIEYWARDGGRTDLRNGAMLCTACHHRIHDEGWQIQVRGPGAARGGGTIWFIPPPDIDAARTPRLGGRAALEIRSKDDEQAA